MESGDTGAEPGQEEVVISKGGLGDAGVVGVDGDADALLEVVEEGVGMEF